MTPGFQALELQIDAVTRCLNVTPDKNYSQKHQNIFRRRLSVTRITDALRAVDFDVVREPRSKTFQEAVVDFVYD
jgi:hypothetical protein